MREIRTLRATWRGLETWHGRKACRRASPRPYCAADGGKLFIGRGLHVAVDRLVGITFVAVPFVLGLQGLDAWYYWANGAAVLLVTFVLNAPESGERALKSAHA